MKRPMLLLARRLALAWVIIWVTPSGCGEGGRDGVGSTANSDANLGSAYYVSPTGTDSVSCAQARNVNTPKLTIAGGTACLASGDTLQVRAGTYVNQTITNPPSGSAPSTYTTITNYPNERPKITNPSRTARGFWLTQGASNNYIEVSGFEFEGIFDNKWEGVTNFPHHIRFINNIVHDTIATG